MKSRQKRIPFGGQRLTSGAQPSSHRNNESSKTPLDNHCLFQPDILLPVQYQQSRRNRYLLVPEQKLALAILEDAVACYQRYQSDPTARGKALFRAAEEWVRNADENWVFSFENICAVLELDPTYLRDGIGRSRARLQIPGRKISAYFPPRRPKPAARRRQSSRSHLERSQGTV
jgi:hypothetical protein